MPPLDTNPVAEEVGHGGDGSQLMRLSGISKSFGETMVVKHMDLDVVQGEILVLLGENGAGKSTLKNIIVGLLPPDAGTIEYGGVRQHEWGMARAKALGIAAIHQELSLFPNMSVAENVNIGSLSQSRYGYVSKKKLEQGTEALFRDLLGIDLDASQMVCDLPLGERQLVEIVKAIRSASSVLVLDEPTTSLSIAERRLLFGVMRRLRETGYGLVHVTHFLDEIEEVADRVAILRDGELVALKPKDELTVHEIEELMVGRELAAVHREVSQLRDNSPIVLDVSNLGDPVLLHDISFQVQAGEVVGIAGLSGAGRSELMQALMGLRRARGVVTVCGTEFRHRSVREGMKLGMLLVSEDRRKEQAFLERTVRQNLTSCSLNRVSTKGGWMKLGQEKRLTREIIKRFDVKTESEEAAFGAMSGGNQQKAVLGRWLSLAPRVCLLDEPTKGIDVGAKADVQRMIIELAGAGVGIVLVSSDLPELFQVSDRILVMKGGTITAELGRSEFDPATVLRAASVGRA